MLYLYRDMGDGIFVISAKFKIATTILHSSPLYKYTVYSPKTRIADVNQEFEFIDSEYRGIMNRVLILPKDQKGNNYIMIYEAWFIEMKLLEQIKSLHHACMFLLFLCYPPFILAEFHVFDAMIHPNTKQDDSKSKGISARVVGAIMSLWNGKERVSENPTEETVQTFDLKQMRNMCLGIYLHDDLNLIRTGGIERGSDILALFNHIISVHNSLCYPYLQDGRAFSQAQRWFCYNLNNVSSMQNSYYAYFTFSFFHLGVQGDFNFFAERVWQY